MEKILIGKFVNTRGLRGELTVLSYSGNMKTFMGYEKYFVKTPRGFEELVVTQKPIIKETALSSECGEWKIWNRRKPSEILVY